jgi:hypothetical protein
MSDSADRIGAEWINFSLFIVGVRKVGVNRLCPARLCGTTTLWAVGKIIGQAPENRRWNHSRTPLIVLAHLQQTRKRANAKRRPPRRSPFQSLRTKVYRGLQSAEGSLQIRRGDRRSLSGLPRFSLGCLGCGGCGGQRLLGNGHRSVLLGGEFDCLTPSNKAFAAPKSLNTLVALMADESRPVNAIVPADGPYRMGHFG